MSLFCEDLSSSIGEVKLLSFVRTPLSLPAIALLCCSTASPPSMPAAVMVSIGQNFTGSTLNYNNYNGIPPDPNGAVGPRHFVEFINGNFTLYNKTNSNSVRVSDAKFWANAGVMLASSDVLSDPRVVYDPTVQRWFASEIDFDGNAAASGGDPTLEANDFLIAVSATSDPTSSPGSWHGFLFLADPDTGYFADFPTLGVDGTAVYLSGDMYHGETNEVGASLISIPKSDLIAASPTIANRTSFGILELAEHGQILQPNNCFDGSVTGKILAASDIGNDSEPHSNIVCSTVLNGGGPDATLSPATFIPTMSWIVPDSPYLPAPSFHPIQPDGSDTLQANEARFSAKVPAVGGVLYAVHNTYLNNRVAIRWYRVRGADNALLESGTIADPDLDLFFPSIAVNLYGVVVVCFNACGPGSGNYISCYAVAGQTINGVTTFGNRLLLQAGVTNYHDLNEIVGDLFGETTTSRWGDYSATSVDPVDPNRFWTIQMYPSGTDPNSLDSGVWSTQITELITSLQPLLSIQPAGTNVTISWPNIAGYHLQFATNLPSISWSNVVQSALTNGSDVSVLLPISAGKQFFRLIKP
jgi:hypothetical protein